MKGEEHTKHYCIRIDGHLDPSWRTRLCDLEIIHEVEGSTLLSGHLPDQAALYGVLLTLPASQSDLAVPGNERRAPA